MVEQIAGDRMGERESVALATKSDGLFFYSNGVLFFKQLVLLHVWVLTMISNDARCLVQHHIEQFALLYMSAK